jgi:hypothetical protein
MDCIPKLLTLPRDGESAEYFPPNHGGRVFHGAARRHASAAKKPRLAARKLLAFSLPQDSHSELMFGGAPFGEPALSGSRSVGFRHRAAQSLLAAAPWHTPQVLQSAPDFRQDRTSRRAIRPKRLQRRHFSHASARLTARSAFGLPQRA